MRKILRQLPVVLVGLTLLLSGCASIPMASPEADARAKTYQVAPGKSNIYIYRNEFLGAIFSMQVDVDGVNRGNTGANSYILASVDPGKHTITSHAESVRSIDVTTEAGKNYFVWQEVKVGVFQPNSLLHLVDEATGRSGVAECKLVASPDSQ